MKKLGGWTRLGIVLSVLWCIGVLVYAAGEYPNMAANQEWAGRVHEAKEEWRISNEAVFFVYQWQQSKQIMDVRIKSALLGGVALGPIVAAWLTLFGIVSIVRWVRQGFRSQQRDKPTERHAAAENAVAMATGQMPDRKRRLMSWIGMNWMRGNWMQRIVLVVGTIVFLVVGVSWFDSGETEITRDKRGSIVQQRSLPPSPFRLLASWLMVVVPTAGLFFVFKSRKSEPKGDV